MKGTGKISGMGWDHSIVPTVPCCAVVLVASLAGTVVGVQTHGGQRINKVGKKLCGHKVQSIPSFPSRKVWEHHPHTQFTQGNPRDEEHTSKCC